jgi:hypothetical protein
VTKRIWMRTIPVVAAVVTAATTTFLATAPAVSASPNVHYGIQDDAWLTTGDGALSSRLDTLQRLGVDVVRFSLRWNEIAAAGPDQAGWDWSGPDAVLAGLRSRGIAPVVTLVGAPSWANGGRAPNWAPRSGASFAAFAGAAARRYPWVRYWTIWNEPNQPLSFRPTRPATYVRVLLNPAYAAIHAVIPRALVAGGVTAPRANVNGIDPISWIRGMRAAHARFDVYAHHPYPGSPRETPFSGGCGTCSAITMANLPVLLAELGRDFGPKRVWLTEYGYQTNPPDRFFGVSPLQQATFIGLAAVRAYELPRVDMLIQFMYRDEPDIGAWQSGLVTTSGVPKPALAAFALPLTQVARAGSRVALWGQVRPGSGPQPYRLQAFRRGAWRSLPAAASTSARGFFRATIVAPRGLRVRVWSPEAGHGAPLTIA